MRRTSAMVLAAAASELFPGVRLLRIEATANCFFCDLNFPFAFQEEMLPLIEERIREIIKEDRPIKIMEMVPSNAAEFLAFQGLTERAEEVACLEEPLISLFQMGNFIELCDGSFQSSSGQVPVIKLLEYSNREEGSLRILGEVYPDKQEMKQSLKNKKEFLKHCHEGLVKEFLFSHGDGRWSWLPKGEALRRALYEFWQKELEEQNFSFVSTSALSEEEVVFSHVELYKNSFLSQSPHPVRLAECRQVDTGDEGRDGLLDTPISHKDCQSIFCAPGQMAQELISSLQFITKISKISNFEHKIFLCTNGIAFEKGKSSWKKSAEALLEALRHCQVEYACDKEKKVSSPRIELRVQDALGREWTISSLSIECGLADQLDMPAAMLARSALYSLERFAALLVERGEGRLPFYFSPEHVRIFAVGKEAEEEAKRLQKSWSALGFRVGLDFRQEKLGTRLSYALSEKVPYLAVLGSRERGSGKIAVRALSWKKEEMMSEEDFAQKLLTELKANYGIYRKSDFEN